MIVWDVKTELAVPIFKGLVAKRMYYVFVLI